MSATILQGDVMSVLPTLKTGSVDCVVSSPPYYALRSYLKADHPLKHLELGSEKSIEDYIANQVRVWSLVREAMASHAVAFVNIGDSYSAGTSAPSKPGKGDVGGWNRDSSDIGRNRTNAPGIPAGNLCLIPQRLALALQADGWLVRSVVCWVKPAPMPSSVAGWSWRRHKVKVKEGTMRRADATAHRPRLPVDGQGHVMKGAGEVAQWADCPGCKKCSGTNGLVLRRGSWRPTSSYEPILMLAKTSKYFSDGESVKTRAAAATVSRDKYTRVLDDPDEQFAVKHDHETTSEGGANLRDVWRSSLESMTKSELIAMIEDMGDGNLSDCWSISAEPLKERHYAAFPSELVYRCLKAGTSARGYCPTCGAPWCRVIDKEPPPLSVFTKRNAPTDGLVCSGSRVDGVMYGHGQKLQNWLNEHPARTLSWRQTCACPPHEPRPARVLDPFGGSQRVGVQAIRLGLDYIGVELSPDYCEMGRKLLEGSSPLFADVSVEDEESRFVPGSLFSEDTP